MTYNRRTPLMTLRSEFVVEEFSGGLNQAAPPDKVPATDFLRFQNARTCDDGKSFERRPGTVKIASFAGKRVLGAYGINDVDETKLLACLNDDIQLKSGGAWGSIFTPTKAAVSPVQIAQHKGLTFIAGYEKPIMVRAGVGLYPGIAAPADAPAAVAVASGSEVLADSYPESNVDHLGELRQDAARTLIAQSFKSAKDANIWKVRLKMRKVGSPTGTVWVEIHSGTSGTSGTKNASANLIGQASAEVNLSSLTAAFTTVEFEFTGAKPAVQEGGVYFIVIYGSFAVSATAFVEVGFDSSWPSYTDGKPYEINGSLAWTGKDNADLVFEVQGTQGSSEVLVSFGQLETNHPIPLRDTTASMLLAQSFKISEAAEIDRVSLALKPIGYESGFPEGNLWVEIHSSQSGTSLTKNASSNIVGQASDDVSASLGGFEEFSWVDFIFSGVMPSLLADTTYYLVLYGDFAVDPTEHIVASATSQYSDGAGYTINSSLVWSTIGSLDLCFEVAGYRTAALNVVNYSAENLDTYNGLRQAAGQTLLAQGFVSTFEGDVTKVKLYLSKFGSPTGNIWVEIHGSQAGTSGSKNSSTNIVGQASDNVDVSTLPAFSSFALIEFAFSGTKPTLAKGGSYYIVVYGDFAVSDAAFVKVGADKEAPEASGIAYDIGSSLAWTPKTGAALVYYLYRAAGDIAGTYSYIVTFVRGGNYPAESNPGPASTPVVVAAGQSVSLSSIPLSADPAVTARNIFRTEAGGAAFKWLIQIPDNTTTTATDNASDAALGEEVSYGNARPPDGTTVEVWDGRLWVAGAPGYEELIFPSGLDTPEQFDMTFNLMLREREAGKVLRIMEFANELWAFKAASIWKVSRTGESYIVDKIVTDIGLGAVGTAVPCGKDMLIFLSDHKRIEILTPSGLAQAELPISAKVKEILASINTTAIHKSVAGNYVERGEYRLAVPTGSNTEPDTVIVFNYLRGTFGLDVYGYHPTAMSLTDHSLGQRALLMGSSAGSIYRVDEAALTDDGAAITMDVQTGWYLTPMKVKIFRTYLDYALPEAYSMLVRLYRNYAAAPAWERSLSGNTPVGGDPALRDSIKAKLGMAVQGKAFSFRFINSDPAKLKVSRINSVFILREKGQGVQAS